MPNCSGDYELWVWAVNDDFGYVILKVGIAGRHQIIRKRSTKSAPWISGALTNDDLEDRLRKRAIVLGQEYRFYRAPDAVTPACFGSLMAWLWYLDAGRPDRSRKVKAIDDMAVGKEGPIREGRPGPKPNRHFFCHDCTPEYQAKLIREDRCSFPHLDIEQEREAAYRSSMRDAERFKEKRGRGRPRKVT